MEESSEEAHGAEGIAAILTPCSLLPGDQDDAPLGTGLSYGSRLHLVQSCLDHFLVIHSRASISQYVAGTFLSLASC